MELSQHSSNAGGNVRMSAMPASYAGNQRNGKVPKQPAMNRFLMTFEDKALQRKYLKYRTGDENFLYSIFAAFSLVYSSLCTAFFMVPILLRNDHGPIAFAAALSGTLQFGISVCIVVLRTKFIINKFAQPQSYFFTFRTFIEDIFIQFHSITSGLILINKSITGPCPTEVSVFETNWCNHMAKSDMIALDVVINLLIIMGLLQFIFRGSSFAVIICSYLLGFILTMVSIQFMPSVSPVIYSVVLSYFAFFYFLYHQETQLLTRFLDSNKLSQVNTDDIEHAFSFADIMNFQNIVSSNDHRYDIFGPSQGDKHEPHSNTNDSLSVSEDNDMLANDLAFQIPNNNMNNINNNMNKSNNNSNSNINNYQMEMMTMEDGFQPEDLREQSEVSQLDSQPELTSHHLHHLRHNNRYNRDFFGTTLNMNNNNGNRIAIVNHTMPTLQSQSQSGINNNNNNGNFFGMSLFQLPSFLLINTETKSEISSLTNQSVVSNNSNHGNNNNNNNTD